MAVLAAFSSHGFSNLHMGTQLLMFKYVVKLEKFFANVNSSSIQKLKRQPVLSVAAGLEAVSSKQSLMMNSNLVEAIYQDNARGCGNKIANMTKL